jgi:hypothetical protein
MRKAGETWNESVVLRDPVTLRPIRRMTTFGQYNQTPTYHTNTAFTRDGRSIVFASGRQGASAILSGVVETGDLTVVYRSAGSGSRDYMHPFNGNEVGDGRGVSGNRLALAPTSGWAVFTEERSLRAVNIRTLEVRTVLEDVGAEWVFGAPSISADETKVVVSLSSAHPQILRGERVDRDYLSYPDHRMRLLVIPLGGGPARTVHERQPCQCSHSAYNPVRPDLVYFDVNVPPLYWCGNDGGVTPRLWLVSDAGGEPRPLRQSYPGAFVVHAAWTWDGAAVAYHGFLGAGGYASGIFIGLADAGGRVIRDFVFPEAHAYGHLNPDPRRPALILDGDLLPGCLSWLYYDREQPRLEVICRHDTEWESMPGQYSHPHPQSDPTGHWISYNAAKGGRSDVYVVEVGDAK